LLRIGRAIEVNGRSRMGVDPHSKFLGVLADARFQTEALRYVGSLVDRVIDPPLPRALRIYQYQLGVVESDANDDRITSLAAAALQELLGRADGTRVLLSLERPRPRHRRGG
jgi:hypothetical protein